MYENIQKPKQKPIFLKIAPDLTHSQLDDIVDIVMETKIAGIVATNTTITRDSLTYSKEYIDSIGAGGLSGAPETNMSTEVIRYLHTKSHGAFPIIGVGGIMTPEDAYEKLQAGASLIQLYSGFIYEGPALIERICNYIIKKTENKNEEISNNYKYTLLSKCSSIFAKLCIYNEQKIRNGYKFRKCI
jgi:dihydroorotate dehydrogenase